jgi:DNA-binding NarL/FixJ family response regulator
MAKGILQAAQGARLDPIRRASTLTEALDGPSADLILLDLSLPDTCRLDTTNTIRAEWPDSLVLILSADVDLDLALMLLRSGASGVIGKDVTVESLSDYVEAVVNRGWAISPEVAKAIAEMNDVPTILQRVLSAISIERSFDTCAIECGLTTIEANEMLSELLCGPTVPLLTPAQLRVLLFVEAGYSNKAAAAALGVGIKTIERHLREIRNRMHLPEREPRQLGAFAQRLHRGCLLTIDQHAAVSSSFLHRD